VLVPVGTIIVGPLAGTVGIADTLWLAAGVVVAATSAVLAVADVRRVTRLGATSSQAEAEPPPQALAA